MVTMPATLSIGENPAPSPPNPPPESNMATPTATAKRPRRYNFSLPTFSWGSQRVIPWVKDPSSISSDATLPPLPPKDKDRQKEKENLVVAEIPWKLRKRKADASSFSPVENGGAVELAPPPVVVPKEKVKEKRNNTKLSVPLSSTEIREDFLLMKGKKPASRPKKRPKHVQKLLDELFPGLWLSEITPDLYKVDEKEEEPCDSDS